MPERAVFERSRREFSLDASVGVHILLVVEQSSLESQSRGCAKTPILTVTTLLLAWQCHNTRLNQRFHVGLHNTVVDRLPKSA